MKRVGFISTALVMVALLGATAFGYAQHGQQHENQGKQEKQATPEKQQGNQQHAQQQQKQNQGTQQHAQQQQKQIQNNQQHAQQQQKHNQNAQQQQSAQRQESQHVQLQRTQQQQQQQESEQRGVWQQRRARSWDSEHRTWQQRGGYNGYRIPDNDFRSYYGRDHGFRVYGLPFMMYGGYPRYQYRGYWISLLDPYPEYWGNSWYQNDDVYVDYYNDGYYLYNRSYPGRPGIAINISF